MSRMPSMAEYAEEMMKKNIAEEEFRRGFIAGQQEAALALAGFVDLVLKRCAAEWVSGGPQEDGKREKEE